MTEDVNVAEETNGASDSLGSTIDLITKHIGRVTLKKLKDDFIDPFQIQVDEKLDTIHDKIKENNELFKSNVMEAVRGSRRELIEERMKEFNVVDLIEKLTAIPDLIAGNMQSEKSQRSEVKLLKESYEAELNQLVTTAGQQGMVGGNTADREAILNLIEDRVKNIDVHGNVVRLVVKATARGSDGAILECNNLNVSKAAEAWKSFKLADAVLEGLVVDGKKLEIQFKSLRTIASLITSMSS